MDNYISNLFSDVPNGFLLMFVAFAALSAIVCLIKKIISILVSLAGAAIIVALILGMAGDALRGPATAVKDTVKPIVCEIQDFFDGT